MDRFDDHIGRGGQKVVNKVRSGDRLRFGPAITFELVTEFLFVRIAIASPWSSFPNHLPAVYEPNPTRPIKSQPGPIKNKLGGLDSGIITSTELSAPRRHHLANWETVILTVTKLGLSETMLWRARADRPVGLPGCYLGQMLRS